jgi:hypothetical protein
MTVTDHAGSALEPLPWFPFDVTCTPGARRTAGRIARRAEHTYWFLRRTLDFTAPVKLRVLDRAAWADYAETPAYGVTHVTASGHLVTGSEPADAWSMISAWLRTRLEPRALASLLRLHGQDPVSGGPALGAVAEALIAHELAHVFADAAGVRFPRRWLGEAFANYAMVAVLGETDPMGLRRLGSLADATLPLRAELPSLARFEAEFGSMALVPSVLAQMTLTRGVYETYATASAVPLARLFHLFRGTSVAPDADFELGRLLAQHVHPTLAGVPALFPAAALRVAA